jgi:hypothetical protein
MGRPTPKDHQQHTKSRSPRDGANSTKSMKGHMEVSLTRHLPGCLESSARPTEVWVLWTMYQLVSGRDESASARGVAFQGREPGLGHIDVLQ